MYIYTLNIHVYIISGCCEVGDGFETDPHWIEATSCSLCVPTESYTFHSPPAIPLYPRTLDPNTNSSLLLTPTIPLSLALSPSLSLSLSLLSLTLSHALA